MVSLTLKVLKASVMLRLGTDLVSIQVDKPSPFPPEVSKDPLFLNFETRANTGVDYCREHLGIENPEVIDTRSVPYTYAKRK